MAEYKKQTADLYKKLYDLLDQLTPQTFDNVLAEIRTLKIDNPSRLQGVADMIFEMAVYNSNITEAYALLCRKLSSMQVPISDDGADKNKESSTDVKKDPSTTEPIKEKYVNFRELLGTKCRIEFEKNSVDDSARNSRIELIDNCVDPEKIKEMLLELEDYDRRFKMKSIGNNRFIDELFKQNMLTVDTLQPGFSNLHKIKDEKILQSFLLFPTRINQFFHYKMPYIAKNRKTADLYKQLYFLLHRLRQQTFDDILAEIRTLKIDNPSRLQGVADMIFEMAVFNSNFSVAFAWLCRELSTIVATVTDDGADKNKESSTDVKKDPSTTEPKKEEYVNFRKLLVTRCRIEFEKNSVNDSARNSRVELIDNCADPEKKKEMLLELEYYDRRFRMKYVGNIRFIGELFKQNMLTVNIMQRCLSNLLETKDDQSFECLSVLLKTIGRVLDNINIDLTSIFQVMKEIVDRRDGKVSSRVRIMIQDVIDLRSSNWVPKRYHRSAGSSNKNSSSSDKKYGTAGNKEGWVTAPSRNRVFSTQSDKLKSKSPTEDEPLGSNTTNMYSAFETLGDEYDKTPTLNDVSSSNKDPYNSKDQSLEPN